MYGFILKEAKILAEHAEGPLPRREKEVKEGVEKTALALARARDVQPLVVRQKHLALAKLRYDEAKAKERLGGVGSGSGGADRAAPADGWRTTAATSAASGRDPAGPQGPPLMGVGPVNPGDVFLTIVTPNKLAVRADAEEKSCPGSSRASPAGSPRRPTRVASGRRNGAGWRPPRSAEVRTARRAGRR